MKLTDAVRELRSRLGESQQVFATKLGISIRGLANYEKSRDLPVALLLRLMDLALQNGHGDLAGVFRQAFLNRISFGQLASANPPVRWTGTYKQSSGKSVDILLLITDKKRECEEGALLAEAQWAWDSDFPDVRRCAREMLDALRRAGKGLREAERQAEKEFLETKRFPVMESK